MTARGTDPGQGPRDATAIAAAVRAGTWSAEQVCHRALAAAVAADGIFWAVDRQALEAAREIDRRRARGEALGPLAGVPVAVKDSFDVAGMPTTAGLRTPIHRAAVDATVVRRLREAGAVVIGKTAMDQLGWSMTGQAPGRPPCPNPAVPGALPGGSSGGSAAAVAAGIVPLALGGDTAGSVRVPAAWCGTFGAKLSHGAVPMDGCAPLAPSMDSVGVFATSLRDCRTAAEALGVPDAPDVDRSGAPPRIGVPSDLTEHGPLAPSIAAAFRSVVDRLAGTGHPVAEVGFALRPRGLGPVLTRELALRWAGRIEPDEPGVRAALDHGSRMAADAYARARSALSLETRHARRAFTDVDVIVLPTTPMAAPPVTGPAAVVDASRFTRAAGAHGLPAVSVPLGPGHRHLALQLIAPPGKDHQLMRYTEHLMRALAC
ncbi:amidase [Streptomyces sp. NPDC058171]